MNSFFLVNLEKYFNYVYYLYNILWFIFKKKKLLAYFTVKFQLYKRIIQTKKHLKIGI